MSRTKTRRLVTLAGYGDAEWDRDPDDSTGLTLEVSTDSDDDRTACVKACRAVGLDVSESHDETGRRIWVRAS